LPAENHNTVTVGGDPSSFRRIKILFPEGHYRRALVSLSIVNAAFSFMAKLKKNQSDFQGQAGESDSTPL
jgi:hypothetical protein